MKKIYINGKFQLQKMTGVQRFSIGVINALDKSLQLDSCNSRFEILLPPNAPLITGLKNIHQRHVGHIKRSLVVWEQLELPFYALDGTLICLSGSAPYFAGDCVPTIHDASVYLHTYAYSRTFATWYRFLFQRRARLSRLVLTVSQSSTRDLAEHLPPTNFRIVSNSAEHITSIKPDMSIIGRLKLQPSGFLLAVGSLNATKNFTNLIDAYVNSSLSNHLPLVIVGGTNRNVFQSKGFVRDHPSIHWAGFVTDAQLRSLYEHAAIFIFPSIYEGFGIPPLEAMHCGCPVAASNASSIPEVCGDAAYYFDPMSQGAMTEAIKIILQNTSLRKELIERGRKHAKTFSWTRSALQLRNALIEFRYIE